GQSFVQMITTSHCSLHLFSATHEIYFDLYSCKKYDAEAVVALLDETFGVKEWHGSLYSRATDEKPAVKEIGSHMKKKVKAINF
ncbi:S-adenosylmethionine decarboxylase, partial [Candidatus Micrarchaeota archaeon]|nr:S-adenosylmethionine decarboxylase [Candidatus Micrarchaeota archaeon]